MPYEFLLHRGTVCTGEGHGRLCSLFSPGYFDSWHNADQHRYLFTLSGHAEIEIANERKVSIGPGQLVLAEDLTGKGHTFRVIGTEDWVALFVEFAQQ